MEIWKSTTKGDTKIIVYHNNTIYKGNPKENEFSDVYNTLKVTKNIPPHFMSIPLRYIKEINFEESKNYIEVLFGNDSSEHFIISDENKKKEIFEFLKTSIPKSTSFTDHYSKTRAAQKSLTALFITVIIFFFVILLAIDMESGGNHENMGSMGKFIVIFYGLASMGVKNVLILFGIFFSLGIYGVISKTRHPKIVHRLIVLR